MSENRACSVAILAAGAGSRMHSSTLKVLHKICGKSMLYYSIKEAQKISDDVSVIIYHQAQEIKNLIQEEFKNVNCIIQDYENLPGTGGAIWSFLQQCTPQYSHLLVLNADMPLIQHDELEQFIAQSYNDSKSIIMSVLELRDASGYGRVVSKKGRVVKIIEEKDASSKQKKITIANAGVYLFPCEFLQQYLPLLNNNNTQNEYYLTDVIALALADSRTLIPLTVKEEHFKGVNTKKDLSIAEEIMLERIRTKWLNKGIIIHQPSTVYIDEEAVFEGECELQAGVQIIGKCKIAHSLIKAYSVIEESAIIESTIGPFAHIRPQSHISKTHIGNFVETKKALLSGIKANHLSYLGDCQIETGTNIGAGVITCNYDGKQKHITKIGKNVFVGSDTQLIAPVCIADESIIAAGSTITQDVPKGSLALSRQPQIIKDGFYYTFFNHLKKIKVNGEWKEFAKDLNIKEIIKELGISDKVLALALNTEVIKKEHWDECFPKNGDELELLHFVGGGRS